MSKNKSDKAKNGKNGLGNGQPVEFSPLGSRSNSGLGITSNGSNGNGGSSSISNGSSSFYNGNGNGNGNGFSSNEPVRAISGPGGRLPRVGLVGNSSIREGDSGSYRLQLDQACDRDMTVTIRLREGSANCFDGNGSGQKYKGNLREGDMPELRRDFTCYDSQGRVISGDTITLTIRAGQTTSEAITVRTWEEFVDMSGRKVMTEDTPVGEGNEDFFFEMEEGPGFELAPQSQQPMQVTIIDQGAYKWHSPLAIDLDGNGINTLSIKDGVKFDLQNTGSAQNVGWISSGDGLLAVDTNGNGSIDNGKELFGGGVGEGFAKLDSFDSNRDGVVDSRDLNFGALKIWQDSNSNGITDFGELKALSSCGIKSLNVAHTSYAESAVYDSQGNILGERGSVNTFGGQQLAMTDVYFAVGG
jgi:serine-aspartate repeat-containing protein C/D/E